jgi:hypothetical protein
MPSPQDLRPIRASATLLVLVSSIVAGPIHAQRVSAPISLQVTGTAASATVTWELVRGAMSYSVKRWKQDDVKCCNNSVEGLTRPAWIDQGSAGEGFPQAGIYVFEVTAQLGATETPQTVGVMTWTSPAGAAAAPSPTIVAAGGPLSAPGAIAPTSIGILAGPAPHNVRVLPGGPRIHTLAWDSLSGISGYSVFRNNTATGGKWMLANQTPLLAATFADTNILQPGAQYRVTALYADGRRGSTDFVYANPPQLEVPTGFAAQKVAPGQVRLSWQSVAFATGYRVFGVGQPADGKLVNGTELVLSGLADGAHEWKLSADYVGAYQTANLPTAGITLYPAPTACTPPQWKPGGPTPASLFFHDGEVSGALISWPPVSGAVAYLIDRQLQPEAGLPIRVGSSCATKGWFQSWIANEVRFWDASGGVTPGAKYLYIVSAVGPAGEIGSVGMYWTAPVPYAPVLTAELYLPNEWHSDTQVSLAWVWPASQTPQQRPPTDYLVSAPYGLNRVARFYPNGSVGGCTGSIASCQVVVSSMPKGTHLITVTARWRENPAASAVLAMQSDTLTIVIP